MPSGAEGVARAVAAGGSGGGGGGGSKGPVLFQIADREVAIVRFLATGGPEDQNFGYSQVFEKEYRSDAEGPMWLSAPGAFDDPEGKFRGNADQVPPGYKIAKRFGIYLYEIARFRYQLPAPGQDGQLPPWARDWRPLQLNEYLVKMLNHPGDIGPRSELANLDPVRGANPGKDDGVRYFEYNSGFKVWFRGVGFNDQFPNEIIRLSNLSQPDGLTSKNIMISRKPSPPGKQIPNPDWQLTKIDEDMLRAYPELNVEITQEMRDSMARYYEAVPPIKAYFEQQFPWPLFQQDRDSEPVTRVPELQYNQAQPGPVDEPPWGHSPDYVPAPPAVNPTPPPVPEGASSSLRRFLT